MSFLQDVFFLFVQVQDFTVVQQFYDTDVNKEYAIRGNAVVLKCQVPSFVADFVTVVSWHTDQGESFYPGSSDGLFSRFGWFFRKVPCSVFLGFHAVFSP